MGRFTIVIVIFIITFNFSKCVEFSNYTSNAVYKSEAHFDAGGMKSYYDLTSRFVNQIQSSLVLDHFLKDGSVQRDKISTDFKGLITMLVIILVIGLILPIFGIFYCCCMCCCSFQSKNDSVVLRTILSIFLFICACFLFFSVVVSFQSNQDLNKGVVALPDNLNNFIDDTFTYLDDTTNAIMYLLDTNFGELNDILVVQLDGPEMTEKSMGILNKCIMLPDIIDTTSSVNDIVNNFKAITKTVSNIGTLKDTTTTDLESIETEIGNTNPIYGQIEAIKSKLKQLDMNTPDLTELNQASTALEHVNNNYISEQISGIITPQIDTGNKAISDTRDSINENKKSITDTIADLRSQVDDLNNGTISNMQDTVDKYNSYRDAATIVLNCLTLVIFLFLLVAILCGFIFSTCRNGCFSRKLATTLLFISNLITFISVLLISIICIGYLLVGITGEKVVCETIQDLKGPNAKSLMDYAKINDTFVGILDDCKQDKSIYQVATTYLDLGDDVSLERIQQYSEDIKSQVKDIADTKIDLGTALGSDVLGLDLGDIKDKLDPEIVSLKKSISGISVIEELKELLKAINTNSRTTDTSKLQNDIDSLSDDIDNLNKNTLLTSTDPLKPLTDLNNEITEIQDASHTECLNSQTHEILNDLSDYVVDNSQDYINTVVNRLNTTIGHCKPLSDAFDATIVSVCDKIITPVNGYWFSLFWALVTLVPTCIASVFLSRALKVQVGPIVYVRPLTEPGLRDKITITTRSPKLSKKPTEVPTKSLAQRQQEFRDLQKRTNYE